MTNPIMKGLLNAKPNKSKLTVTLTKDELHMLDEAFGEFELSFDDGWQYSGYTKSQIKNFFNAKEKLFGTPQPNIKDLW